MATVSGQIHSYSNTQPQKRTVTDKILLTDPNEIAAISVLGLNNESRFQFVNTPGRQYEWLQDTYRLVTDTGNDNDIDTNTTETTLTVTTGEKFSTGDIITWAGDDELMYVTSVSGDVLTVVRGVGGTSAATHTTNGEVAVRFRARIEGAASSDSPSTEVTTGVNYSMILQAELDVTRTNALIPNYGMSDPVGYQLQKKVDELMQALNRAVYYSTGVGASGSSTVARIFGGFEGLITTNNTALSSAALTEKNIQDELQDCWTGNGRPDVLFCGAWAKRKIADFFGGYVRTERQETVGGVEISTILSPLGNSVRVVVDRDCPTDTLYIIDTSLAGFITIDPLFTEELGKVGDTAFFGQVVGEYGFVLAQEDAHSYLSGFSITA